MNGILLITKRNPSRNLEKHLGELGFFKMEEKVFQLETGEEFKPSEKLTAFRKTESLILLSCNNLKSI